MFLWLSVIKGFEEKYVGAEAVVHPVAAQIFAAVFFPPDGHAGAGAGAGHVPDVHVLDLVADGDAAHAVDALGHIPDEGIAVVPLPVDGL